MGLRHICHQAERLPDWYGVAYRAYDPPGNPGWGDWVRVCYPVPLNLIVRVWHGVWDLVWRYVKAPHRFRPTFDTNVAFRCRELENENVLLKEELEWQKQISQSAVESRQRAVDELDPLRWRVKELEWEQREGRRLYE